MLGDSRDVIAMFDGSVVVTHGPSICEGEVCCIHNPSPHRMVTWPQFWHNGWKFMFRQCPHGALFPDPDELKVKLFPSQSRLFAAYLQLQHPCEECGEPQG